ncbi:MAG: hypothetical protein N2112_01350 [Gemmataceae bacterium]|jgi:hypothetical protein|nr:hypothetical protein [Gemmataceae bacterium]
MKTIYRRMLVLSFGGILTLSIGCQTWIAGMTLPSPSYLKHNPQYFPEEPAFPLPKELAAQEEAAGLLKPAPAKGLGPVPGVAPAP